MNKCAVDDYWIQLAVSPLVNRAKIRRLLFIVVLAVTALTGSTAEETTGPSQGTLVIVGGGDTDHLVFNHFVELAGGVDAKLVVIPTASSSSLGYDYAAQKSAAHARDELMMPHVTVVHTHDRTEANQESFVKPIREADAVWFGGGRQWRIADAYLGTLVERELRAVLERGGVIGGSSAGASIQGSFLVRGDTSGSSVLIGDHQRGLGYLSNAAIDQHVIPRNRQSGLIEVLTDPDGKMDPTINRQDLLGIGIDEATGIVVRGSEFEVVGKEDGVVLLYDPRTWTSATTDREKFLTLWKGAKYDLKDRIVLDGGTPPHPKIARRTEGYYKDIFMDGGVKLSSKKRLPAAESLGLSYEYYAGKDSARQQGIFVGTDDDANGVLLYPDGQPRFRLVFVNGGGATSHGKSLGESGRQVLVGFFNRGGSYCGSCAGSFLSGRNTDARPDPRDGYLHIFPWNTLNTDLKKARVGHFIPRESPLLRYGDFGKDHYVADIYHNNGNWLAVDDLAGMQNVEALATYDTPDKKTHEGAAIWAWKNNETTGRIVNIGSHPEGITNGERLELTEACFQYAVDGAGSPEVKAMLRDGVIHHMDKGTADNDPLHTKIGDRQYHHFTIDVAPDASDVEIELTGDNDFHLNLYLHKETPAFRSNASYGSTLPGATKRIRAKLVPGRWFASVECATTVDAVVDETQSFFTYTGNTDVLNGVPYRISLTTHKADDLAGPPIVSAKAWAIADGKTGKLLWGSNEDLGVKSASTTKIMCASIVLGLSQQNPKVLEETVVFSHLADETNGSTSGIRVGESVSVRDCLFGLLLASGNDAGNALAEHFNGRFEPTQGEQSPRQSSKKGYRPIIRRGLGLLQK